MRNYFFILLFLVRNMAWGQNYSEGCNANISTKPSEIFSMLNNSGNPQLDNFLSGEVRELRRFFEVDPTVVLYQDNDGANARAMRTIENQAHQSGTVILGINMIQQEFAISSSGTTIPLILAHEFGHIVDYKKHVTTGYGTKISELFADFQAGCFLFYRSVKLYTDIRASLLTFYSKGEYDFNNPDHHGTPQERLNALLAGYNWLQSVAKPGVNVSQESSISEAKRYLGITSTASYQPTISSTSGSLNSASSTIKSNTSCISRFVGATQSSGTTTYSYSVRIINRNAFDVIVTVGGLTYGHYQDCSGESYNYVKDGEFDSEEVKIAANSTETIELAKTMNENPPVFCSGVKPGQHARIISVAKDE